MTDNVTPPAAPNATTNGVLDQLVGPDKKFKDVESLAKGKAEADAFVQSLTRETKELRELMNQLKAENDTLRARTSIIDRLSGTPSDPPGNPPVQNPPPSPATKGLTGEDVLTVIEQHEQKKQARANRAVIEAELSKTLGTEAAAFVKQRASELGYGPEELVAVGERSPEAFFRMLGIQKQSGTGNPMYAGSQSGPQGNTNPNVRTYNWYQAKRKEMGNIAFLGNRDIQLQMHKDALALGEDFYK